MVILHCLLYFFIMKKISALLLLTSFTVMAAGQTGNADTMRIINLKEVSVSGIKKTTQQQLISFFKTNNAATLEEILARLPEVSLIRRGSYGMEPVIRYFNGGQINVQVDGMKIHGACTDKMDPATIYIEPINLQNIQVQTANSGFISGSSIGGTVNMKMAEPDFAAANKITGVFSSGYQTAAKSVYESLRLNYAAGKWAVAASGTYRNSKNYRSGGGTVIPFSQYEKTNGSLSVKFQQNGHTWFKADILADDGWNIGYPALPMDVGYAAARIASLSMHKENAASPLYKWQVKVYANSIRHFMDDSKRPNVLMHMDMPGWSKTYGMYAEGERKISVKQKLLLRADASSTFLKASMTMHDPGQPDMFMLTWPDNRRDQYGTGASWLWQADSLLQVQVNGRMDITHSVLTTTEAKEHVGIFSTGNNNRTDILKNLSAQLSKKINRIKITAGAGYSERMPTASELFGFYLFNSSDGHDYIGNPLLKIEKALQADVSVVYTRKRTRVQVSGYYSRVNNFISATVNHSFSVMTTGAAGVKTYSNLPYATVTGGEASFLFTPATATAVVSTLRYTIAKDNSNEPLPFVPPLKNITSIRWQPAKISVQLESEAAVKQNRVSTAYAEDKTAGYFLLHARAGYTTLILKTNATLQAGVENIFDKNYHEHPDWKNIARPGRNFYVQLKTTF